MPYNPTVCEHIENWILWFIKKIPCIFINKTVRISHNTLDAWYIYAAKSEFEFIFYKII